MLSDLMKIAQCIIHFEPAFEAILPEHRRGNIYAKSNWLDNPTLGHSGLSRQDSIQAIEMTSTVSGLVDLMNPSNDKMFGWNFLYMTDGKRATVEFRRGAGCTAVQYALMYAELTIAFVGAAIQSEGVVEIPATVGGLKFFLSKSGPIPKLVSLENLDVLFGGKSELAFCEPKTVGDLSVDKLRKLQKKKEKDERKIAAAEVLQSRY